MHGCTCLSHSRKNLFICAMYLFNVVGNLRNHPDPSQCKKHRLNIASIIFYDHDTHSMTESTNSFVASFMSAAFSKALMKAVPITAPLAFSQAASNVCLSLMPKPTSTGLFNFNFLSFCR